MCVNHNTHTFLWNPNHLNKRTLLILDASPTQFLQICLLNSFWIFSLLASVWPSTSLTKTVCGIGAITHHNLSPVSSFVYFPTYHLHYMGNGSRLTQNKKSQFFAKYPQSKVLSLYQISFVFVEISEPCSTDSALKTVWIFTRNLVQEIISKAPSIILWENSWASSQFFLLYNHPLSLLYALCPFFCLLLLKNGSG